MVQAPAPGRLSRQGWFYTSTQVFRAPEHVHWPLGHAGTAQHGCSIVAHRRQRAARVETLRVRKVLQRAHAASASLSTGGLWQQLQPLRSPPHGPLRPHLYFGAGVGQHRNLGRQLPGAPRECRRAAGEALRVGLSLCSYVAPHESDHPVGHHPARMLELQCTKVHRRMEERSQVV